MVCGIGLLLLVLGVSQIINVHQKYERQEKKEATIYRIDVKREKYETNQTIKRYEQKSNQMVQRV